MWEVNSLNPSDTRYGISRTFVNSQGRFQLEKFTKTFASYESAVAHAKKLNKVVA
jgi:hypothetical protein